MAHKDDVTRVLATCTGCGSVYAARQWPDGAIRIIGRDGCSCGSTEFEPVEDEGDGPEAESDEGGPGRDG